jgi:hypothetical protein
MKNSVKLDTVTMTGEIRSANLPSTNLSLNSPASKGGYRAYSLGTNRPSHGKSYD